MVRNVREDHQYFEWYKKKTMAGGHGKNMAVMQCLFYAFEKETGLFMSNIFIMESSGYLWGIFPREANMPIGRVAASMVPRIWEMGQA
jgi:hypothetical protein